MFPCVFILIWIYEAFETGSSIGSIFEENFEDTALIILIVKMSIAGFINSFFLENYYPQYQDKGVQTQRLINLVGFALFFALISAGLWLICPGIQIDVT